MEALVPDLDSSVLEPSHPYYSTLRCPGVPILNKSPRFSVEESVRKEQLKGRRGCRRCVECGFWKHGDGFVRSLAKRGSPRFRLRMFRTCNHCSRRRKNLDEDEHFDQYGGLDSDP
ncbi:hypothetical protein FJTKL_01958 [Diaporthe vaccinii]|uniref:Stc1 domain-containing protein n=1 Tax=Diaporthe vaccinii TaxID=105482 RepID=A0ABR4DZI5_9PEZI